MIIIFIELNIFLCQAKYILQQTSNIYSYNEYGYKLYIYIYEYLVSHLS
jgi:hypothetical protein